MPSTARVKDLIRAIRACKTAKDERDLINKECAYIRTAFKEDDQDTRARNVAKTLYINMLGYPAHFGQMECLKLVASSRFADKRMGYLGTMMLLDERQDVHLLVTNSMKNDLKHQVQYVVGLALCAFGSICSDEMGRDLSAEVEKLLRSSNPYIVRKAALCAVRIVRKVPELMELYVPPTRQLLNEKNHGVLLTGVNLVTEICKANPDSLHHFRRFVPNLVRILKNLVMSGYSPEHDVHGISDPFLQCRILRLLRILGKGDKDSSESMNDILAQVATNTDSSKNVGHTILYETVITIMEIESESGLRVLAVNILGRFLQNSDRNIRYVALNTLLKTVSHDNSAVQRHRNTILDCLKENDISLRKRALELSFALINSSNVRSMVKEIMEFLNSADPQFKPYIATNLLAMAEKYSPSKQWYINTVLSLLIMAGNHVREDLVSGIIAMVSESTEHHGYCVRKLFSALRNDISQHTLSQVSVWMIGEYGDQLVNGTSDEDGGDGDGEPMEEVTEDSVLDVLERVIQSPQSTQVTREYTLTTIMKLSTRFSTCLPRIKAMITKYGDNLDMELQQRAVEYCSIFSKHDQMRMGLLEPMPTLSTKLEGEGGEGGGGGVAGGTMQETVVPVSSSSSAAAVGTDVVTLPPQAPPQQQQASLLDLLSEGTSDATPSLPMSLPPGGGGGGGALLDLLNLNPQQGGGGGGGGVMNAPPPMGEGAGGLLDLLGGGGGGGSTGAPGTPPTVHREPDISVLDKDGLKVSFSVNPSSTLTNTVVTMTATNSTQQPISEFLFQAAVPKTFQLQLMSPSGNFLPPFAKGTVTQVINITNPQKLQIRMRVRITYVANGVPVQDQSEVTFPLP